MNAARFILNLAVAAALTSLWGQGALAQAAGQGLDNGSEVAQPEGAAPADRMAQLLADLKRPDNRGWQRIERQILMEWSKSGSAAMDLLLQRGREALREDDIPTAIDHLTALTDHAPEFAEGWHQRATAYFQAGQYGPAMLDLSRALALNPNHFGAMAGMATLLVETGNKPAARQVYQEVLAIHPNLATVRDAMKQLERELSGQNI